MSKVYVEDEALTLPTIKDGVYKLGDLWNCHSSKACGANLFLQKFDKEHLSLSPIRTVPLYSLTHIKSTEDIIKNVKVEGSLKIELLSGLIPVEASACFVKLDTKSANEERLICKYNVENYLVELLPFANELVDPLVVKQIVSGEISATHVVKGVFIGGEVCAQLHIKQLDTKNVLDFKGDITGKLVYGAINATVKAKLKFLDSEKASNYEKHITIQSKPPISSQPSTVEDMFREVEKINQLIEKEQHFDVFGPKVQGIPIRFRLVPIKQFMDFKVERLYLKLKDDIMEKYCAMLTVLHDYRQIGYLNSRIIDQDNRLNILISDTYSKLTKDVTDFEQELKNNSNNYFKQAFEALEKYKSGGCKVDQLFEIVDNFDSSGYSTKDVDEKVNCFVAFGKEELSGIHDKDELDMDAHIKRFTNKIKLNEWLKTEIKIKLLLYTNGDCPDDVFTSLFQISKFLDTKKIEIEIGVAVPSISDEFLLLIKVKGKTASYKTEEIPFVLGIVSAVVGIDTDVESYFHSLNASLSRIYFPSEGKQLNEINNIIDTLKVNNVVYITRSSEHSLPKLTSSTGAKWKFFICLDAIDTSLEAIEKLQSFRSRLSFVESEWIAGSLNIRKMHAAPLLFVFCNSKLAAICFDKLDLLIIERQFNKDNNNPDLSLISPEASIKNTFYPDKSRFALEVFKLINRIQKHVLDTSNFKMASFDEDPDQRILDALELTRIAICKSKYGTISTIAKFIIDKFPKLEDTLRRHGWSIGYKTISDDTKVEDLINLCKDLEDWLMLRTPFLAKIESARINIELFLKPDNFTTDSTKLNTTDSTKLNELIEKILADESCSDDLSSDIVKWTESSSKQRYGAIAEILEKFTSNSQFRDHINSLIMLLKQIKDPETNPIEIAIKPLLDVYEVLPHYVNRIPKNQLLSVNVDKIKELLLNRKSFELVTLLAKYAYDSRLTLLHSKLDQLSDLDNSDEIVNFLKLFTKNKFQKEHWLDLCKNPKFRHIIENQINSSDVLKVFTSICLAMNAYTETPDCFSGNIAIKLKDQLASEAVTLPEILADPETMVQTFQEIMRVPLLPLNFQQFLKDSIDQSADLKLYLQKAKALHHWIPENMDFSKPWDLGTVKSALTDLIDYQTMNKMIKSARNHINSYELEEPKNKIETNKRRICIDECISTIINANTYSDIEKSLYLDLNAITDLAQGTSPKLWYAKAFCKDDLGKSFVESDECFCIRFGELIIEIYAA